MYDYNNSSCYLGFVEPYRDLECEVVWHPGFNSPEAGEFNLCVRKGNIIKLKCFAKVTHHTTDLEKKKLENLFNKQFRKYVSLVEHSKNILILCNFYLMYLQKGCCSKEMMEKARLPLSWL